MFLAIINEGNIIYFRKIDWVNNKEPLKSFHGSSIYHFIVKD